MQQEKMIYEDIDDNIFFVLNDRIPNNFYWSQNYSEQYSKALQELIGNPDEPFELFKENIHKPENAKTEAQKFLIFHHWYHEYEFELFKNNLIQEHPPYKFIFVEGLPGVGKTFVIKTLRKIVRRINNNNNAHAIESNNVDRIQYLCNKWKKFWQD